MWFQEYLFRSPIIVFVALLIFAAAFLLHEVAHKFMAQRLGYWAEYRLNELGLMITLLSFISPIKVIAPGAVVIAGLMYGDDYGKISLSGPVANIVQAVFFLLLSFIFRNSLATFLTLVGVAINSSLALFNLIPFGVFDGVKILRWSWKAWLVVTTISAILFIYAYF
jgi:Zn-dependent protease